MKIERPSFRYLLILIGFLLVKLPMVQGQENNSMYFMDRIPQSTQLNPAIQPRCNLYIGMPVFSSIEVNAGNNSLGLFNILQYSPSTDSLLLQFNNVLTVTKNNLLLYSDSRIDLISFGFRVEDSYFTFAISERMETTCTIPKDLLRLAINGNPLPNNSFNLNNLGANSTYWREYSLGYSKALDEKITLGMRVKLLFGKANVSTNSTIDMTNANISEWTASTNIDINSSIPGFQMIYFPNGKIDTYTEQKENELRPGNYLSSIYNPKNNIGLAMDLGFVYNPFKMLSVSAGLLDLGYINWKNNLNNLSYTGNYKIQGAPFSISDTMNLGKSLLDTLKNFPYQHNQNNYMTTLSPKLYIGVHIQPIRFIGFGALERLELMQGYIEPQTTISLNLSSSIICLTLSYTLVDGMTDNFGIATNLNLGPLQFYISSDRLPLFWAKNVMTNEEKNSNPQIANIGMVPEYYKSMNLHFGINLVFGYVKKEVTGSTADHASTKDLPRVTQ